MNSFLVFMIIILIIILFLGVINPKVEINKSTRLKVFLIWLFFAFIVTIIAIPSKNKEKGNKSSIEEAITLIDKGEYSEAIRSLKRIKDNDQYFTEADSLINVADSLSNVTEEERIADAKEKRKTILRESLQAEIKNIDEGINFSMYRGSIVALQLELELFNEWRKMIWSGNNSDDPEIQELVKRFKPKVERVQINEFPKMRKEYANISNKTMWEEDIEVSSSGTDNKLSLIHI